MVVNNKDQGMNSVKILLVLTNNGERCSYIYLTILDYLLCNIVNN